MITHDTTWLGLSQVAREMNLTRKQAYKHLHRVRWVFPPEGSPPKWDARVLDLIRAMRGLPHRQLEPVHEDWLTRYLEEPNARPAAPQGPP